MYKPLYPPEGGPPGGFKCGECGDVTRTEKGIRAHLKRVHGIVAQGVLFDVDPIVPKELRT